MNNDIPVAIMADKLRERNATYDYVLMEFLKKGFSRDTAVLAAKAQAKEKHGF